MSNYTTEELDAVALRLAGGSASPQDEIIAADVTRAYAATLRQQAGRVDEGVVRKAEGLRNALHAAECKLPDGWADAAAEWTRDAQELFDHLAALAQNTQGDGEPVAEVCSMFELRWVGDGSISRIVDRHGIKVGDKLYLHAERARVPEWLGAPLLEWALGQIDEMNDGPLTADQWAEDAILYQQARDYLAAAPYQPKDAGEVES